MSEAQPAQPVSPLEKELKELIAKNDIDKIEDFLIKNGLDSAAVRANAHAKEQAMAQEAAQYGMTPEQYQYAIQQHEQQQHAMRQQQLQQQFMQAPHMQNQWNQPFQQHPQYQQPAGAPPMNQWQQPKDKPRPLPKEAEEAKKKFLELIETQQKKIASLEQYKQEQVENSNAALIRGDLKEKYLSLKDKLSGLNKEDDDYVLDNLMYGYAHQMKNRKPDDKSPVDVEKMLSEMNNVVVDKTNRIMKDRIGDGYKPLEAYKTQSELKAEQEAKEKEVPTLGAQHTQNGAVSATKPENKLTPTPASSGADPNSKVEVETFDYNKPYNPDPDERPYMTDKIKSIVDTDIKKQLEEQAGEQEGEVHVDSDNRYSSIA